ncbi:MAG: RNA polymerase sigma factor RpoD/SigA [Gemmatimonadetes bacterium]|nr:RNA polymerase sigma factor RpoD/SigA [Gemmatimonadota bacterium]
MISEMNQRRSPVQQALRKAPGQGADRVCTSPHAGDEPSLAYYYKEIERHPLLTSDQEKALTEQIALGDLPGASARTRRAGEHAREKLITSNLRFVIHVAKNFKNQGLPLADLINEGNMGLMTAARKFKPEKGYKFITYAVWWIRQNILKALEVQTRSIRIPGNVINDLNKLRKVEADMTQHLNRHPDADELAQETDLPLKKVTHTLESAYNTVSLDTPMYDEVTSSAPRALQETLPDPQTLSPEDTYIQDTMHNDIHNALGALPDRDRQILHLYYGFSDPSEGSEVNSSKPATYQQIGNKLGVSRERVRQLKEEALNRLRHPTHSKRLATYCS